MILLHQQQEEQCWFCFLFLMFYCSQGCQVAGLPHAERHMFFKSTGQMFKGQRRGLFIAEWFKEAPMTTGHRDSISFP